MLAKSTVQTLIQLVDGQLNGLSLVDAGDRRYLRELTTCRDELLRCLLPEDRSVVEARMIGARLGRESH